MLATTHSCPDARLFLRSCHAAGFEPRIAFQNDDYSAILGFVAAGVGVALIPDMVSRGSPRRRRDPGAEPGPAVASDPGRAAGRLPVAGGVGDGRGARRGGRGVGRAGRAAGAQRVTQASGSSASWSIAGGSFDLAMSSIVTCSTTRRRLARTAIQTRGSVLAAPA